MKLKIKLTKSAKVGIIASAAIIFISALLLLLRVSFFDIKAFYFVLGVALVIGVLPFFIGILVESRREDNLNMMFLEFSRDLVEGVKSGTPISKSIINLREKDYESLNPFISKLANQIGIGIPVKDALETFASDIKSSVISRAVSLIKEAETSGGKIETILESVAFSVSQIEKLKKERKAAIYNLAVQGYIIFLIFIVIMLVMQFKILPITTQLNMGSGGVDTAGTGLAGIAGFGGSGGGSKMTAEDFSKLFLMLLITQGFFAGLVIGKISEGSLRAGLKHSFILVAISWLMSTGANIFLA